MIISSLLLIKQNLDYYTPLIKYFHLFWREFFRKLPFCKQVAIAWCIFQHCEYKMDQSTTQMSRELYEIQFFGFTPDSFVNGGKTEV